MTAADSAIVRHVLSHYGVPELRHAEHIGVDSDLTFKPGRGKSEMTFRALKTYRQIYASLVAPLR